MSEARRTITHRELRNESSRVLREVRGGESFVVTNAGEPCAVLSPPEGAGLRISRRRVRRFRAADLRSITSAIATSEVIDSLRDDLR